MENKITKSSKTNKKKNNIRKLKKIILLPYKNPNTKPQKPKSTNNKRFFFDLSKIPETSKLYPKTQNYSCYTKLINSPKKDELIYNIPGTLINTKKKKSVILRINGKKTMFKSISFYIDKIYEINYVLSFLSEISSNYNNSLITFDNINVIILKIKKLKIVGENNIKKFYFFIERLFKNSLFNDKKILNELFDVKKLKIFVNEMSDILKLKLKIDTLHIVGENSIEKIYKYIEIYKILVNKNLQNKNMCYGMCLTATNIVYSIRIPPVFTENLYIIHENLSMDIGIKYTYTYEPDKFPALVIKIIKIGEYTKKTLEIYQTGYILITGFKTKFKINDFYNHILNFIYLILEKKKKRGFFRFYESITNNEFDNYIESEDIFFIESDKNFNNEKLEEEFRKEEDQLKNVLPKKIFGNSTGLMFRKSDLKEPKKRFTKRYNRQYNINIDNLKKKNSLLSSYYNETLNLFNISDWSENSLKSWFSCMDNVLN